VEEGLGVAQCQELTQRLAAMFRRKVKASRKAGAGGGKQQVADSATSAPVGIGRSGPPASCNTTACDSSAGMWRAPGTCLPGATGASSAAADHSRMQRSSSGGGGVGGSSAAASASVAPLAAGAAAAAAAGGPAMVVAPEEDEKEEGEL